MAQEIAKCINGHRINEVIPEVDHAKFEVQHPELIGKPCDCGRFVYTEKPCGCTVKEWRVDWIEKIN